MVEDVQPGMNDSVRPHEAHDPLLIAALASKDLDGPERTAAETLLSSCADCRFLFDDLRALATAAGALPPVPRQRDFRLTAEEAARLRSRRTMGSILSGAWFSASRSLAIGLTTIGIAGLVLAAIPNQGLGLFGAGAAPQPREVPAPDLGTNSSSMGGAGAAASGSIDTTLGATAAPAPGYGTASSPVPAASPGVAIEVPASAAASAAPSPPAQAVGPAASASPATPKAADVTRGPGASTPSRGAVGEAGATTNVAGPTAQEAAGASSPEQRIPTGHGSGVSSGAPSALVIGSTVCLLVGLLLLVGGSLIRRRTRI